MPRRFARLGLVCALLVTFGVNCRLEHPLPPPVIYQCQARIHDAAGRVEPVSTETAPFSYGGRLVGRFCPSTEGEGEIPGYWTRRLRRGVESDPAWAARGPWCVERIECRPVGPSSVDMPCPEHVDGMLPLDTCPNVVSCLALTPGPSPSEPGFESVVSYAPTAVGAAASQFVTVQNVCPSRVALRLDPRFQGAHPEDFTVASSTCGPRPGETQSRALEPLETCRLQVSFRPRAAGARGARLVVGHDLRMNQQIAFRGFGEGGTLAVPAEVCVGGALTPVPDCRGGATGFQSVVLTNSGTRSVTVQRISPQAPNGVFQVAGPAPPFRVEPGSAATIQVRWCRTGTDAEVRGALTFTTDGTPATVFTNVDRRLGGCP